MSFLVASICVCLGFTAGALVFAKKPMRSQIDQLIDQVSWLPIRQVHLQHRGGADYPVIEFDGGVRLVKGRSEAWIEINDTIAVGIESNKTWNTFSLSTRQKKKIAKVMMERLAESAIGSSTSKLLECVDVD